MPTRRALVAAAVVALAGAAFYPLWQRRLMAAKVAETFADPLSPPDGPLRVYHLGHSLVGRDMPAMVAQLAPDGHGYESQLGWGSSLRDHWEPDVPVNGFEQENDHPRFRPARPGIASGDYDAIVLTEMVEITDAIRYHDSAKYLARWAALAAEANPDARLYLYETWHHTSDPAGWAARIDNDLGAHWLGAILHPALRTAPIHLIPAGQVMAAFVRAAEGADLPDVKGVQDLMARNDDGTPDTIHLNDLGAYLVALTHVAVLYHLDPQGLPHDLARADGSPATPPAPDTAALMQRVVWDVVTRHPETGVAAV